MSLAKKCDLCGVLYEHYSGRNGISLEKINSVRVVVSTEKTFDLCPDCMTAIAKIMEERADKNGRNL